MSRWIHNEMTNINLNSVPYMMTKGGASFAQAYAAVEKAMGCATSVAACNAATVATTNAALAALPASNPANNFFDAALAGTGYCTPGTCAATAVANEFANFQSQSVWSLWSDLDKAAQPRFQLSLQYDEHGRADDGQCHHECRPGVWQLQCRLYHL